MRDYLIDCLKIEEMMGEIYRKYAAVGSYSVETRKAFELMARDEDDHARQLQIARGVPEEIFFEGTQLDMQELDDLRKRAQDLLSQAADPPYSEHLVLQIAKELEKDFMRIHLLNAVKFKDPSVVQMFKELAREDRRHVATLKIRFEEHRL